VSIRTARPQICSTNCPDIGDDVSAAPDQEDQDMTELRIRAITPIHVGPEELERRQARYDEFSPQGVSVVLEDLPDTADVPRQLASAEDIEASERAVIAMAMATDPARFDLILPDCVLDTGVRHLRDAGPPVPVVGLSELTAGFVGGLGLRMAAVTRNRPIGDELGRLISAAVGEGSFRGVENLELSFADISDDVRWNGALEEARQRIDGAGGADVILNGCSAVDVSVGDGIPVFDPTRLALRLLAIAATETMVGTR
jgi:Asp/Glu/hydantoin racemase